MSRIGKQLIAIPQGVTVEISPERIQVKGPKGELAQRIPSFVIFEKQGEANLAVRVQQPETRQQRAQWGLFQRLVRNMIIGVSHGFEKQLEWTGVGYKASVAGTKIVLNVGFSHPVEFQLPAGISAAIEKNVMTITGIDKQLVGEVAAKIRRIRPPEPYKGKGIKYVGEVVRRKAGKQATKK